MIRCLGLTRTFGTGASEFAALDGLDLHVEAGETRCLLGPNGAGKTSLALILSTVLRPSGGRALVDGLDVVDDADRVRRLVRLSLGGDRGFHFGLSVFENVRFWATMYGLGWRRSTSETERVLELVGMGEMGDQKTDNLSRGMKQRVHLARCLLGDAPVLLLDEPTAGLDPVATRSFRALIFELKAEGRTILLTTHDMDEAESLADRITLLNHGRVEATGRARELRDLFADRVTIAVDGIADEVRDEVAKLPEVVSVRRERSETLFEVEGDHRMVLEALVVHGVLYLRAEPPSLEQLYLRMFGDRGLSI